MSPKGSYMEATVESTPLLVSGLGFICTLNFKESEVMHHFTPRALSICGKLHVISLIKACSFFSWNGCHDFLAVRDKLMKSQFASPTEAPCLSDELNGFFLSFNTYYSIVHIEVPLYETYGGFAVST